MPQTSPGGVSNSSSKAFTNNRASIALVNYGKLYGSVDTFVFNANNQNTNNQPKFINKSLWSGTYNENKIY
jgi:hypothetical protein